MIRIKDLAIRIRFERIQIQFCEMEAAQSGQCPLLGRRRQRLEAGSQPAGRPVFYAAQNAGSKFARARRGWLARGKRSGKKNGYTRAPQEWRKADCLQTHTLRSVLSATPLT